MLCAGVIRSDSILIRCWAAEPPPNLHIQIRADGQVRDLAIELTPRNVELDALMDRVANAKQGAMRVRGAIFDCRAPLPNAARYESISVRYSEGAEDVEADWATNLVSLRTLSPRTRPECRALVSFIAERHIDPSTLRLVARQVTENEEAVAPYRVNALVVYLYKTIEAGAVVSTSEIRERLVRISELVPTLGASGGAKEDPRQLLISLYTAAWHVFAHCGDRDAFAWALNEVCEFDYKQSRQPFFAFNLTKSALIAALASAARGDVAETTRLGQVAVAAFRYAAPLPTRSFTGFNELRSAHEAAAATWRVALAVEKGAPLAERAVRGWVSIASRTQDPDFLAKLYGMVTAPATVGEARA